MQIIKTTTTMTLLQCGCYAALIGLAVVNAQGATINGYSTVPRVSNDNPGSTLTSPASLNSNPATLTSRE